MGLLWICSGAALYALILGVVVFRRSPRHPAHVAFAIGMTVFAAEAAADAMALRAGGGAAAWQWHIVRLMVIALIPAPWLAFSRCYSRGDALTALSGRAHLIIMAVVIPVAFAWFFRGHLLAPADPLIPGAPVRLGWAGIVMQLMILLTSVAVLTNLERTFRSSVGVMRWRMKYMVLGVGALFGFRLYAASQAVLYHSPEGVLGRASAAALWVGCILITVALTRGSVFDVDVYPSQTLIFGSLTVLLAGAYLVIVGLLSRLVSRYGGDSAFPLNAFLILVALAGLAVLLLSERLRQRLRRFVSRHFRRPVYDYRRVWSTFTAQTTSLVDEGAFCRAVASWASETFQALSASVWLVDESGERLRLGGSTALADSTAASLGPTDAELQEALAALRNLREPTVIDPLREHWATVLQRLNPEVFREGGSRVCQPLNTGGRLLGFLILGDRVAGLPFTTEDFDLLRCVGDQVAENLLALQLSAQLLRAKELEAFQTMSAFFVHDLKNTASALSLTLQNLNQHFSDPAFREDALRTVGKSVQHLNNLIARLSRLRQELRVQPVPGDLAAVVEAALAASGTAPSVRVHRQIEALPPVLLDAEQMEKVVVNLLVNAREAVGPEGEVRVAVGRENGWAALSVSDNGCGMSQEFMSRSLFRPFQTTKKNGLGIGMFHSKMIVEAHQGRMEVESAPGRGTTVRVLIPFASIV